MKTKTRSLLRGVSGLAFAAAIAVTPLAHANAASTVQWSGNGSDSNFSTVGNWVGGAAPGDGDTVAFDSTVNGVTYPGDLTSTPLTNDVSSARFAGLTATGGSTDEYNFAIDTFATSGNATLQTDDNANHEVTITSYHSYAGNVTLQGVHVVTGAVDAGDVTFVAPTGKTETLSASNISGFTLAAGKKIIIGNGVTLTLSTDALSTHYTVQVNPGGKLALTPGTVYTTPIILNGGQVTATGGTSATTTVNNLTVSANSFYDITDASSLLRSVTYTNSGSFTMSAPTPTNPNEGTFIQGTAGSGDNGNGDNGSGDGTGDNGSGDNGAGAGDTDTPGTPDTAFHAIVTNPLTVVIATIAIVGATAGIVRLQRSRRSN